MLALLVKALGFFIVNVMTNVPMGLIFINLNPWTWKRELNIKNGNVIFFLSVQVLRVLTGAIFAFFIYDVAMVDHTVNAFVTHFLWVALFMHVGSSVFGIFRVVEKDSSVLPNVLEGVVSVVSLLGIALFCWIYPLTIYTSLGQIPKVEVTQSPIEELDPKTLPLVLPENAIYKADKKSSSLEKPSFYEEGEVRLSNINGELVHSIAIEFSGMIKANKQVKTPGYYTVSATDVSADSVAEFHKAEMKYGVSNVFKNNLTRKLRDSYPNDVFFDTDLEQDDEGKPFYITSFGHYEYFRSGSVVDGVIVTNPEDGSSQKFKVGEEPKWIDQVYPQTIAKKYFDFWGVKRVGFNNARKNIGTLNHGDVVPMFNKEKEVVYVTYFTRPTGSKGGMSALGVFNAKTGKITIYESVDGLVTGDEALAIVSQTEMMNTKKTWVPKMASIHTIYGVASYTVPIYDADDRYVGLSIVKANGDNRMVAFGSTKEEAFEQYKMLVANQGNGDNATPDEQKQSKKISGTVKRIAQKNQNMWLILLNEDPHFFAIEAQDQVVLTQIGDQVTLDYYEISDQTLPVSTFKNDSF